MDNPSFRLEFAHRMVEEMRFTKYIRDYFHPNSYAHTKYAAEVLDLSEVTEVIEPDFISEVIDIVFKEEAVEYEEVLLHHIVDTPEEEAEIEDLWDNGYYLSCFMRIKFLRELYEGDRELYDKARKLLTVVTRSNYDAVVECYVGGYSQVDAFNKEECYDIIFFGEHSAEDHYEFFADFHQALKDAYQVYKKEYIESIDDRLAFLLNVPKEELWNEGTH